MLETSVILLAWALTAVGAVPAPRSPLVQLVGNFGARAALVWLALPHTTTLSGPVAIIAPPAPPPAPPAPSTGPGP